MENTYYDVVIVGAGMAGLSAALSLPSTMSVFIVAENAPQLTGSTPYAQGGIAFAQNTPESVANHVQDTITAGAGLSDVSVVKSIISNSHATMEWLQDMGTQFDINNDGTIQLDLEAAHSVARIAHIGGDATGLNLSNTLHQKAMNQDNITFFYNTLSALLTDSNGAVCGIETAGMRILSNSVILATGGASGLFGARTAPAQPACAFKVAMEAGAYASDMEFFQHHPTALDLPSDIHTQIVRLPLISEAVRGKGATLITGNNKPLDISHEHQSLAPRDVVARAVFQARQSGKNVYLETSSISDFASTFPTINACCEQYGVDTKKIPIRNAVHYQIGGIETTVDGKTSVPNLYVIGEAAATGLHGANRLASNSLLEASIMGRLCAKKIAQKNTQAGAIKYRLPAYKDTTETVVRDINDRALGIVRNQKTMHDAIITLSTLQQTPNVITSQMACLFAILRTESIGVHYRSDYPDTVSQPRRSMDLRTFQMAIKQFI